MFCCKHIDTLFNSISSQGDTFVAGHILHIDKSCYLRFEGKGMFCCRHNHIDRHPINSQQDKIGNKGRYNCNS